MNVFSIEHKLCPSIRGLLSCLGDCKFTEISKKTYFESIIDKKTFESEFSAACSLHNQRVPYWHFVGIISNGTTFTEAKAKINSFFKTTSSNLSSFFVYLDFPHGFVNSSYEPVVVDFSLDSFLVEWVKEHNLLDVFFIYKHGLNTNKPSFKKKYGYAASVPDIFYLCKQAFTHSEAKVLYDVNALNNTGLLNVFIKESGLNLVFDRLYKRDDVKAELLVNQF